MLGIGIGHREATSEVIGLNVGEVESRAFWTEFLRELKQRVLDGLLLAISDQHETKVAPLWAMIGAGRLMRAIKRVPNPRLRSPRY